MKLLSVQMGFICGLFSLVIGTSQSGYAEPPQQQVVSRQQKQDRWKPALSPLITRWGKQVTPENAWREYPRPQMVRSNWENWNGLWDYAITPKNDPEPKDWAGKILVPFAIESALSGVGKRVEPNQALWYHRTFKQPLVAKGQKVLLHFDAVDWHCKIFLNGKQIGEHKGGSDPFQVNLTPALTNAEEQNLTLWVWDPTDTASQPRGKQVLNPNGIWYTAVTGIWQTVWSEIISDGAIKSIEPISNIDEKKLTLKLSFFDSKPGDTIRFRCEKFPNFAPAVTAEGPADKPLVVEVPNAKLWSPDHPNLYDFTLSVVRNGETIDEVKSYFAMRSIALGKDQNGIIRLMLNHQPLFQMGTLDQGWWPDGLLTPPSEEAMVYDVKVLKQLGFNMFRKHIKVEPSRLYYFCDKIGMLVWQDMPSAMGANQGISAGTPKDAIFADSDRQQFLVELKAIIDHLKCFPCIVVWVPFNEGWGQHDTNDILQWVMKYEPTRMVNGPSGWVDRGVGHMKDMHNYPGPGMFPILSDRASVLGEFGGLGLPVKKHLWQNRDNWGYQSFNSIEELRAGYHQLIRRLRPLIGKGLSAAVYTQTTDVEGEVNGVMTYDRELIKLDIPLTNQWHQLLHAPAPIERTLLPIATQKESTWAYSIEKPGNGWMELGFDDSSWKKGAGGFGTAMTPGAKIGTEWSSDDIYIRKTFELEDIKGDVFLQIHHDEDAEIYINGLLAAKLSGYTSNYTVAEISPEARKTLQKGKNTIAIHCHQTRGGQYIDAGLIEWTEVSKKK